MALKQFHNIAKRDKVKITKTSSDERGYIEYGELIKKLKKDLKSEIKKQSKKVAKKVNKKKSK